MATKKSAPVIDDDVLDLADVSTAVATAAPSADSLKRVLELAALLGKQEAAVEALEDQLKIAKSALLVTQREHLPELMREIGVMDLTLQDGRKVLLKDDLSCSIKDKLTAHKWLIDHDFGGLIKTQVIVEFAKGARDEALKCVKALRALVEEDVVLEEVVHPATLKSFVKEQLTKPENELPLKLFNVSPFSYAKTEAPKNGNV